MKENYVSTYDRPVVRNRMYMKRCDDREMHRNEWKNNTN